MRPRSLLLFVVGAVGVAAVTHLLSSAAVALALDHGYQHRVVDLRRWPVPAKGTAPFEAQHQIMARFFDNRLRNAALPTVAFLGSSFSFGYPWQEPVILSRRYADIRTDQVVLNASVTGADLAMVNNWMICTASRQRVVLDVAIVEIPVINTVSSLSRQEAPNAGAYAISPLEHCAQRPVVHGYFGFAARQTLGLGWVRFLWDVEAYYKREEPISIPRVPEGYFLQAEKFATIEQPYRAQIAQALRNAQAVARTVYVFASPVYLPGLGEIAEDGAAVRRQLDVTLEACRAVTGVRCLDSQRFYDVRGDVYNLTHLNQRGHADIGAWLANEVHRAAGAL